MLRIRHVGVVQTATVVAICLAVGAVALTLVFTLLASVFGAFFLFGVGGGFRDGGFGFAGLGGLLAGAVALVIGYAVVGWIATAVACIAYNLVARWTGGIELQIEQVVEPPPVWQPIVPAGQIGQGR